MRLVYDYSTEYCALQLASIFISINDVRPMTMDNIADRVGIPTVMYKHFKLKVGLGEAFIRLIDDANDNLAHTAVEGLLKLSKMNNQNIVAHIRQVAFHGFKP